VVEVWSVQSLRRTKVLSTDSKDAGDILISLAFSDDGSLIVAGGRDDGIYVWNINRGRLVRRFEIDNTTNGYVIARSGRGAQLATAFTLHTAQNIGVF
jgi:WD40 repeat protein